MKKQRDFIDTEVASINIFEAKASRFQLHEDMVQIQKRSADLLKQHERATRIAQTRHSIEWLAVDDKTQEDHLSRISHRRHDETCQWVLQEPRMIAWIQSEMKYPVLWLNGKPGAGKWPQMGRLADANSFVFR